jgi:hypothetical protein
MYTLTLPATSADTSDEPDEPEEPTVTEPATEAPTEPPVEYPIITENSYLDENISITVTTLRRFGSNFHVAEIRLSSPQYLKTALAKDTYGLNIKEKTSAQARRVGAILAINGDYYGANEKGYVIRNGVLYRKSVRPTDDKRHKYFEDLAILWDGSFMPFDEKSITGSELLGMGAMQSLAFGPTLIKNGSITVDEKTEVGVSHPGGNPRTAICYVGEGHYLFVVADGRTEESEGLSLYDLAEFMKELAAQLNIPFPAVLLEPGRSIVADAGLTMYTVGSVKRIKGYKNYVSVDGGMTDNPRYALYRSQYTVFAPERMEAPPTLHCDVVGRCCESDDIIQPDVWLPELRRGDLLAVCTTGAYNYAMASHYNRIPNAPIVMLSPKGASVAVKRETPEDIASLDL